MSWRPFKFARTTHVRRPIRRSRLNLEQLESRLAPSVNVLTFHNDIARTGLNANETLLTPSNVQVGSFDKLFVTAVEGNPYPEPVIDTGIANTDRVKTQTRAGG